MKKTRQNKETGLRSDSIGTTLGCVSLSYQPHPLQARMSIPADDDVVVHGDAERGGDLDDRLGHLDVRLRGRRIAGGVVVYNGPADLSC